MTKVIEHGHIYKNLSLEDIEGEIWKDISELQEFEHGYYHVSNMGRYKSLSRIKSGCLKGTAYAVKCKERIISQHLNIRPNGKDSYLMVKYNVGGMHKSLIVHRLVARLFVDNPNLLDTVDHINNVKTDNRAVNLQWMSSGGNTRKAHKDGLANTQRGEITSWSKLRNEDVIAVVKMVKETDLSYKEIGKLFNVTYSTVNDIVRGRTWVHITGLDKSPISRPSSWLKNFKWKKEEAAMAQSGRNSCT